MPNIDGHEFRRRQRQDSRLANIPVIVISSEKGTGGDPTLAGSHFLRKPVDFARVHETVKKVLSEQRRRPPQPSDISDAVRSRVSTA
jgi:CheY-like chemotaxis protein